MIDGKKYGPTAGGRYYQPADYHCTVKDNNKKGRKAKNKQQEVKTHWVRTKSEQYDVFLEGDNNEFIDAHGIFSCPLQWRIMSPSMPLIRWIWTES